MNKYTGTFRKSDGTTRTMHFVTEKDARFHFGGDTPTKTSENPTSIGYANKMGRVLVYDVDVNGWRYFNTSTQVGDIITETSFNINGGGGSTRH